MPNSGIYKIQSINFPVKIYIGSAINLRSRKNMHFSDLRKGSHSNIKLQNHYNKYGETDLVFSVIEPCLPEFLIIREQHYIDILHPSFNICPKAGSSLGVKRSEAYIQKMRERKYSPETKKLLSDLKRGKPTWSKGKHLSEEHKNNIAKAQMGENNSFFNKKHTKKTKKIIGEKSTQMHILKQHKVA
jgi:group I intron endonuclease